VETKRNMAKIINLESIQRSVLTLSNLPRMQKHFKL